MVVFPVIDPATTSIKECEDSMSHNVIPDVRKLAVVRANAIGDFVFGLPAFDALRAAYPAAEIILTGRQ